MGRSAGRATVTLLAGALALSGCSVSLLPAATRGSASPSPTSRLPRAHAPGTYTAQPAPRPGGRISIGTAQLPTALSPYFQPQAAATPADEAIYDGLLATAPDLSWYGDLARDVPTVENGGVQPDGAGMRVTYHLRHGLAWSDGQPITPDDVAFTLQTITGPGAAAGVSQEGYEKIAGIDSVPDDPDAFVVRFRSLYAAYRDLFSTVLPRHRLQAVPGDQLAGDPFWTKPDVVSGPFEVMSAGADRITLSRNPHYADGRAATGLLGHAAYADQVVLRGYPTLQAVLAGMRAGEVQAGLGMTERELPTIARLSGLHVVLTPSLGYEQVSLNQVDPNPGTGRTPPWIGDPAVARALDLALDRPSVERGVGGQSPLTSGPVSPLVAWAYDASVSVPAFDLARARSILDEDGWKVGSGGVRTRNGQRLSFVVSTTGGVQLRATERDLVVNGWRRLGVDVQVQDFTVAQLFASYDQGGVLAQGMYEAALWAWIVPPDPDSEYDILHSSAAPGSGRAGSENYSRCHDPAVDQSLAAGRGTLDLAGRGTAYRSFEAAYQQARCELPLFRRLDIGVSAPNLRNFAPNPGPAGNTWNLADWWLA